MIIARLPPHLLDLVVPLYEGRYAIVPFHRLARPLDGISHRCGGLVSDEEGVLHPLFGLTTCADNRGPMSETDPRSGHRLLESLRGDRFCEPDSTANVKVVHAARVIPTGRQRLSSIRSLSPQRYGHESCDG